MYPIYEPAEDSFLLQKYVHHYANGKVLDMGTGSGIQAIAAAQNWHVESVLAVDINSKAITSFKALMKKSTASLSRSFSNFLSECEEGVGPSGAEHNRMQEAMRSKLAVAHDVRFSPEPAIQENIKTENLPHIKVKQSDLFQNVPKTKFNTIIFNPPYLPQDPGIVDPALYGGKKGYELSERFFQEVSDYLETDGQILFLFSTLTHKVKIEQILAQNLLSWEELGTEKVSFETLYVYRITKNPLRKSIESHNICSILYYNKGKRGLVYKGTVEKGGLRLLQERFSNLPVIAEGDPPSGKGPHSRFTSKKRVGLNPERSEVFYSAAYKGIQLNNRFPKLVAIKINQPASPSCRLDLECRVLRDVNRLGIGPEFYAGNKDYLIMEFINGTTFPSWLPSANALQVRRVLGKLLAQCFALDQEHYTKEEMHHPFKHIIVTAQNHPVLIDFERCTKTDSPKNLTQFVEYLCRIQNQLSQKDISFNILHIRAHAKAYKHSPTRSNYTIIRTLLLS